MQLKKSVLQFFKEVSGKLSKTVCLLCGVNASGREVEKAAVQGKIIIIM